MIRRAQVFVIIATVLCAGAARLLAQGAVTNRIAPVDPATRKRQLAAYSAYHDGGLHAAAAVTGSFELSLDAFPENPSQTLDDLVRFSVAIVIGHVGTNAAHLDADGMRIATDHQVIVERVLKGDLKQRDVIDVSVLGGRVTFPDGTWARIVTPDVFPMSADRRYVLFLRMPNDPEKPMRAAASGPGEAARREFRLTSGSQGEYPIERDGRVTAFGPKSRINALSRTIIGRHESPFVADIVKAIARQRSAK